MYKKLSGLLVLFGIVSATFLATYFLSIKVLLPFQAEYTPKISSYTSLLFLPHGVRVLSAWLLGWKAIPLIFPAAFFSHWLNFGMDGFTVIGVIGMFSGVVCAVVTFWGLAHFGIDFRLTASRRANWRDIMIAGCIASVINTVGMGLAFDHDPATSAGYFIGDVSGMLASMLILMLIFKALRNTTSKKPD
jgi:hypothetical protein